MQYFTDGLGGFVRVDTAAALGSRDFFFARAEKLGSQGIWFEKPKLMFELLNSGYYEPTTEEEVSQIASATALTPDVLIGAYTFSSTKQIIEDPGVNSATLVSA